ncbi:MAG: ABC transporter permease [Rhodothermales bacterium]
MLKNYLKISLRNLQRHKGYSSINIAGLAVGLACCVLMLLYIRHELSYDRHYEKADRIYRIVSEEHSEDGVRRGARSPVPLGPMLKQTYPEAEDFIRFWRAFQPVLRHEDQVFREHGGLYFTDPGVFDVFSLDLLEGDPQTALVAPGTIVLTTSMAHKYFGEDDAMGKVLAYEGFPGRSDSLSFTVTGILPDLPEHTHLAFDALASLEGIETEKDNFGSWKPIWTYVLLPEHVAPEQLESKFPDFVERYLDAEPDELVMHLEPITDIHLHSRYEGGFKPRSDIAYVYLFAAVGFFILLIACINFVNLATARSLNRAREVGMRKVLGAYRQQLIRQFLGEALLLSVLALILALVLVELFLPVFNGLFDKTLTLAYLDDGFLLAALPALVLLVGLLAGIYPAFFLSGFRPATALKGRFTTGTAGARLRKALVVFQFAISVALITGTALVYSQLDYMRSKHLGFDKNQVVVMPHAHTGQEDALLATLLQHPNVLSVAVSQRVPVHTVNADSRPVRLEGFQETVQVDSYIIGATFLETYGMDLAAGRDFSKDLGSDADAFLINETAVKRFGWGTPEEALGKQIAWQQKTGPVVGVVRDFHLDSMHEPITPLVLHMLPEESWWRTFISVKIRPTDTAGTLAFLEQTWSAFAPENAYEYVFIDESFEQLHRADARFGRIFGTFATLAIVIACLGLFGLAAFTAEQRTKEIGIRKVLGASVSSIALLLSTAFTKLVVAAFVLATPIAYLAMTRWLENFAYRVEMSWPIFLLAGALALAIALLTVSYQAIRAALANPVKALRYE